MKTGKFQPHNRNISGFTLIELLILLAIVSLTLTITTPIALSIYKSQHEKHFFHVMNSDILLIQNIAVGGASQKSKLVFQKDQYTVINSIEQRVETRSYPSGWKLNGQNRTIYFKKNGTIGAPGTIVIHTDKNNYKVIFPLGKGRGYVEKQ
ncbi:competence type IV pilus minor pilin ComGD [Virgibacillus sp. MG-45]|uniref:competence type IV pilus minor pilin ComGD n=1 Tax=Virgibacillus sp. MG-45 TaxID=3102791 RepID=UPI002ED827E8